MKSHPLLATFAAVVASVVWFFVAPHFFHGAHSVDLVSATAITVGWIVIVLLLALYLAASALRQLRLAARV